MLLSLKTDDIFDMKMLCENFIRQYFEGDVKYHLNYKDGVLKEIRFESVKEDK